MGLGVHQTTLPNQTPNTGNRITAVRVWGISLMLKRETAQTDGSGPKIQVKCTMKGSESAKTVRMLS
jgi:hypothetical protein